MKSSKDWLLWQGGGFSRTCPSVAAIKVFNRMRESHFWNASERACFSAGYGVSSIIWPHFWSFIWTATYPFNILVSCIWQRAHKRQTKIQTRELGQTIKKLFSRTCPSVAAIKFFNHMRESHFWNASERVCFSAGYGVSIVIWPHFWSFIQTATYPLCFLFLTKGW